MRKIIRKVIQCKHCGYVIESVNAHDYATCSCGTYSVDGGRDYFRRSYQASPEANYIDLREYVDIATFTYGEFDKDNLKLKKISSLIDVQ